MDEQFDWRVLNPLGTREQLVDHFRLRRRLPA